MKRERIKRPPIVIKLIKMKAKGPKNPTIEEHKVYGKLHRRDGPAKVYESGRAEWWLHGVEHRVDGPAVIHSNSCEEEWFFRGNYHRNGGPAVTYPSGAVEWWSHGCLHRENGPAFDGKTVIEWHLCGRRINSKEEYQELLGLSDEDMTALILKYGNRFDEHK